jgi:deoxycytidine triphosphate deaminase
MDPPHGGSHRHDRAVRAGPGAQRERRRLISYGTSSYGYDVRCADEFKIFTNINSTIVDPKTFDPNELRRLVGDVCIIPPNSFALARTVEYFRIPRNVLTSASARAPTRAAASSSTSRRSSRSGKGT